MRESFARFGYPQNLIAPLGIIEAILTILYIIPQTSVLGAILLTGIREEHPTWIVPVVTGVLLWIGLYLRDQTLRALVQHFLIQE